MKNLILLSLISLPSCHIYQLDSQDNANESKAKFFVSAKRNLKPKYPLIHVQLDGNNFRYYYMFYKDKILKNDFKRKVSALYRVTFDSTNTSNLTNLDSIIFKRVISIMDSLQFTELISPAGTTGFKVEKTYK